MQSYAGDMSFDYTYDTVLSAATTVLPNEAIRTDTDSDFLLYGLSINAFTSLLFVLQFRDSSGNYFSSDPVQAGNYAGQGAAPYLFIGKPRIFPPGSQLGISIQNLSGEINTIQLLFRGEKRYVKPQPICSADALTNRLLVNA
jgi:hypothetical protein